MQRCNCCSWQLQRLHKQHLTSVDGEDNRERWRGKIDAEIKNLSDDIRVLFAELRNTKRDSQLLELKVERIATKIGLYASIGAFLGGGVMSLIVGWFFHK